MCTFKQPAGHGFVHGHSFGGGSHRGDAGTDVRQFAEAIRADRGLAGVGLLEDLERRAGQRFVDQVDGEPRAFHHAVSRIPGEVSFSLEIRSLHQPTLEAFYALILDEIRQIEG